MLTAAFLVASFNEDKAWPMWHFMLQASEKVRVHRRPGNLITNFAKEHDDSAFRISSILKLEGTNFCKMVETVYQAIQWPNPEICIVNNALQLYPTLYQWLHAKFETSCYTILPFLPLIATLALVQGLLCLFTKARQLYLTDRTHLPWYTVRAAVLMGRKKQTACSRTHNIKALLPWWTPLS
jgi:hypothetical protein